MYLLQHYTRHENGITDVETGIDLVKLIDITRKYGVLNQYEIL
jgi:hypothetical protein